MENLIPLHTRPLSGQPTDFANARELHAFLEIGRDFSNWIKARIKQYSFAENEDYICVENLSSPKRASAKSRVQKVNDYFITLDMAKELAMVERNDKGRQARRYFIDCERQLKNTATQPAITGTHDTDKLQLLNNIARSMGMEQRVVVIPMIDVMGMVQVIRHYQAEIARLQINPSWIDDTINNVKTVTGMNFGE